MRVNTQTRVIEFRNYDFRYGAGDFVNPESFDFHRRTWSNREPLAYVIHTSGTVLAIVFPEYYAYTESDALDEAVDSGKLDSLLVSKEDLGEYETGKDSEGNPEYEGIAFLGNASEPFDQQNLEMFTLPARLFSTDPLISKVIADNPEEDSEPPRTPHGLRKIRKEDYAELSVFLMDHHSGQTSRGYRLLSRLNPQNFSSRLCAELRETEIYQYLVSRYADTV